MAQMIFEWGQVCGDQVDRFSYRLNICLPKGPLDDFKKGGNGKCRSWVSHLLTLAVAFAHAR
jgi:hypothetical protein